MISLVFTSQSYFKVPKLIRQNATYYFTTKKSSKNNFKEQNIFIFRE